MLERFKLGACSLAEVETVGRLLLRSARRPSNENRKELGLANPEEGEEGPERSRSGSTYFFVGRSLLGRLESAGCHEGDGASWVAEGLRRELQLLLLLLQSKLAWSACAWGAGMAGEEFETALWTRAPEAPR